MAFKSHITGLILASTAVGLAFASPAYAQDAVAEGGDSSEDEIIVTAQKRDQNLQDVPMSITAVTGDSISERAQVRLDELSNGIPNLKVTEGFTGNTLNVRGIGSGQGNAGFEQSVATFSDGVYVGRSRMSVAPLADVERVEVLRGPQPVYFGQNAVAGALSITTRNGKGPLAFDGSISYGNDNDLLLEGGLTLPIVSDKVGLRLTGRYTDRDGYLENVFTGKDEAALQTSLFRATLNLDPVDALAVTVRYEHGYSEQTGIPAQLPVNCGAGGRVPGAPPFIACVLAQTSFPSAISAFTTDYTGRVAYGAVSTLTGVPVTGDAFAAAPDITKSDLVSGQIDLDLGGVTLTSITAHGEYSYSGRRDIDGTPFALVQPILTEDYSQFSQELRLTSNDGLFGGLVDYLVGGYYQKSSVVTANKTFTTLGPTASGTTFDSDDKYLTGFAAFTFNLNDKLRINLGGRYSDVQKDAVSFAIYAPQTVASSASTVFGLNASVTDPTCATGVVRANSDPNPATLETQCLRGKFKTNNFDYQIGTQYDVADDVMLFATYSKGSKAGGLVQSGQALPSGPTDAIALASFRFQDESAKSFELGFKSRFLDRRVRLNVTAFHTEFKNLQVNSFDVVSASFQTTNAASATSKGLEFDGDVRLSEILSFTFSGALTDAKFDDYPGGQCSQWEQNKNENGCTFDLDRDGLISGINPGEPASDIVGVTNRKGRKLLFAPNWTLNFGLKLDVPVGNSYRFGTSGEINLTDDYEVSDRYDPRGLVKGFERINFRVEFGAEDRSWTLAAYGNNLTDQQPLIVFGPSQFNGQLSGSAVASRGRTYGMQARFKF